MMIRRFFAAIMIVMGAGSLMAQEATVANHRRPLSMAEATSLLHNPADLYLHEHLLRGSFVYGNVANDLGGSLMLHIRDFGLGDFSLATNYFTDGLYKRAIMREGRLENDVPFSYSHGVGKSLLSWAKRSGLLSLGLSGKYYHFNRFNNVQKNQYGLGLDIGMSLGPIDAFQFGAVVHDVGSTVIYDRSTDKEQTKIPQLTVLNMAYSPVSQFEVAAYVPYRQFSDFFAGTDTFALKHQFPYYRMRVTQLFNGDYAAIVGYSPSSLMATLSVGLTDFFNFDLSAFRQEAQGTLNGLEPNGYLFSLTYRFSHEQFSSSVNAAKRISRLLFESSGRRVAKVPAGMKGVVERSSNVIETMSDFIADALHVSREGDWSSVTEVKTIGIGYGEGVVAYFGLQQQLHPHRSWELGIGLPGFGVAYNFHIRPQLNSDYVSLRLWNQVNADGLFGGQSMGLLYHWRPEVPGLSSYLGMGLSNLMNPKPKNSWQRRDERFQAVIMLGVGYWF